MRDIRSDLVRWLAEGEQIALATVIQTWGSSPRGVGAKMAIASSGRMAGSVSGGCVEAAVVEAALEVLESRQPRLLRFGVADETAWEVGLACGGELEVFVNPLRRASFESFETALEQNLPLAIVTIINGPAGFLGEEMIFCGGQEPARDSGGWLQQYAVPLVAQALTERHSRRSPLVGEGGPMEVFVEVILPPPTLVIVGGAHIARALTSIARTLGYRTVIVDPRRAFGDPGRFADADRFIHAWPQEAFSEITLSGDTAVCSLVHDPKIDDPALGIALNSSAFYIGALGSRKTHARRCQRLLADGVTESALARLHTPIGLDIGAESPEEIALAIMAEIVSARHANLEGAARSVQGTDLLHVALK
jgi:xanthine dehydrogenase accessory factor